MSRWGKIALVLPLLAGLLMMVRSLFMPEALREQLGGLAATGPVGEATLYADFGALFTVFTLGVAAALFFGKRDFLFAPLGLFGLTAVYRVLHGVVNGFTGEGTMLIVTEVVICALIVFAWRSRA